MFHVEKNIQLVSLQLSLSKTLVMNSNTDQGIKICPFADQNEATKAHTKATKAALSSQILAMQHLYINKAQPAHDI